MRVPSDQTERVAARISPVLKGNFERKATDKKQSMSDRLRWLIEMDVAHDEYADPVLEAIFDRSDQLVDQVAAALYDHPTGGVSGQARRWSELYSEEARETWREAARRALSALEPRGKKPVPYSQDSKS